MSALPTGALIPPQAPAATRGWRAELELEFSVRAGRTVLSQRRHVGPLVVQRPFYPEQGICHVYLLHPPGGIVGGDTLACRIAVEPGAHAVLTTPAATKFYRSMGAVAEQKVEVRVNAGTCEWLPQESIYFANAQARACTRVDLEPKSRFLGWDMVCLGRPASGEAFEQGKVHQAFELWREGRPLFVDRLHVNGAHAGMMQGAWGLGGHPALGTLLAFPATAADQECARAVVGHLERAGKTRVGVSLVDGVLVVRCLARRGDWLREVLVAAWQALRPRVAQCPAVLPRVWAT